MKRNKILFSLVIILLPFTMIRAQEITFSSQELEACVRYHLGIDVSTPISSEQLKSITDIDLSHLGITDISDIAYMPGLRTLDLHDNEISDISPLLALESLSEVNLSYNNLSSVFPLSFSRSQKMKANVAFNHIDDFSVFLTLTPCQFTIAGAGLQTQKDMPYFRVRYLYSDGTETQPTIYCRVDATTVEQAQMTMMDVSHTFAANDQPYSYRLNDGCRGTHQVKVSDGTYSDSTYIVALRKMHVEPSGVVTFSTELPENFELSFSPTQNGTLSCEGTDLTFKASASFDYEEVIYSFYCGGMFKGLSKLILTKEDIVDEIDTPDEEDSMMNIALNGNNLSVQCLSNKLAQTSVIEVCDIAGRMFVSKSIDSSHGIDEHIPLTVIPKDIIIVKVSSGKKRFVEKYVVK